MLYIFVDVHLRPFEDEVDDGENSEDEVIEEVDFIDEWNGDIDWIASEDKHKTHDNTDHQQLMLKNMAVDDAIHCLHWFDRLLEEYYF